MDRKWRWSVVGVLALPVLAVASIACSGGGDKAAAPAVTADTKAAAPAAATAAPAVKAPIYIVVDTVFGSKGMSPADVPLRSCVETSRIKAGDSIGWRVKIIDTATGKPLDNTAIEDSAIKLSVPGAKGDFPVIKYGDHGGKPPTDAFFAAFWTVPADQPTGVLPWSISVTTKDGRTATLKSDTFNVPSSWLTVMPKA